MQAIDLENDTAYSFVIFGASGHLALTKIFPALWMLYRDNRLPQGTRIYTFSRTKLHTTSFRIKCIPYMGLNKQKDPPKYNRFWNIVRCLDGEYDQTPDYMALNETMLQHEHKHNMTIANRIFYLALPPIVFDQVTLNISRKCMSSTGWTRIILEKPFASNDITYRPYQTQLCQCFKESEIYMIDHHLNKQVVQNLLALRFGNCLWEKTWNNQNIAAVMISFKCDKPVLDRADYFDSFGIIRDVMTNHMMQLVALLAMEQPYTSDVEHMRDEKVKLLNDILSVNMSDVVLGQYINSYQESDPTNVGYLEHPYIPKNSTTPTFALIVLHIRNKRWAGVPFILRAGKALNERKVEVRVQYKRLQCDLFDGKSKRNELVLRLTPCAQVFMRLMLKTPAEQLCLQDAELNMMVNHPYVKLPVNYHSLLLDVFAGNQMLFMRSDEQCQIWRIFSPLFVEVDNVRKKLAPYAFASRGPMAAYKMAQKYDFEFYQSDEWHQSMQASAQKP